MFGLDADVIERTIVKSLYDKFGIKERL